MKKCLFWGLFLFFQICLSQPFQNWKGYFSYNQIKGISESSTKLYAAAENALFTKNLATGDIKTINTIDGLSGQTISAIYHSEAFNKTIVGYQDGLMIVINDADGSMLNVVDIINKNIPANIKKINHFMEYNGIVYVSCDFGIVQYKLATLGSFGPFISLGGQFSFYDPKAWSELGPVGSPISTPIKYADGAWTGKGGTVWSIVGSIGSRYKLTELSDLMLDLRWQYYFSNWVDGLNPDPTRYPENRANDWNVWLNVGYIYYLQ